MTFQRLKKEAASLSAQKQAELAAYLVHLRNQRDPIPKRLITRRLNDHDPKHWLTLDKVKERLSQR